METDIAQRRDYRPDIDGLRAVAVLSVMLFHFGVGHLSGGFLGVDVFFVISGFLITGKIATEIDCTGKFRFFNFYRGRFFRLYPALFVTILVSGGIAAVMMSPFHLQRFGGELISALFSVSNFYFWMQSGYFDAQAIFKPLLHTWSLAVEDQFYLVWPLVLFLGLMRFNRRWLIALLVLGAVLSVGLAQYRGDRPQVFYLAPYRAFEFAIGAILVWLPTRVKGNALLRDFALPIGLLMIAVSLVIFDEQTRMPSVISLIPCLGTALCLMGGNTGRFSPILSNGVAAWIGRISYSLYLVHWPLVVFYSYGTDGKIDRLETCGLLAVSFVLAAALHYLIEKPFRYGYIHIPVPSLRWAAIGAFVAAFIAVPSLAANAYLTDGWLWRLSPNVRDLIHSANKSNADMDMECHYRNQNLDAELIDKFDVCEKKYGSAVLIIGDSHGTDLFNALAVNSSYPHVIGVTKGGCRPFKRTKGCQYQEVVDFVRDHRSRLTAIIYTQAGDYFLRKGFRLPVNTGRMVKVREYLLALGAGETPLVWVGPQWEPSVDVEKVIPSIGWVEYALSKAPDGKLVTVDQKLASLMDGSGIAYVSKLDAMGPMTIDNFIVNDHFTYSNADHWSADGERYFGAKLLHSSPVLSAILPPRKNSAAL